MSRRLHWRLGLRLEGRIFFLAALLILALVSTTTLFAYRHALEALAEERRGEALRLARHAAVAFASGSPLSVAGLQREAPGALGAALLDPSGRTLAETGIVEGGDRAAPLAGRGRSGPFALGPGTLTPASVAAFAPFERDGQRLVVRVDIAAERIAALDRGSRVLTAVVLPINLAVILLVLVFLRRFLKPYDTLLERARTAEGSPAPAEDDEVAFLVGTFERALAALARPAERDGRDELAALERALGSALESGALLVDREGRVLALNPVGAELLGIPVPASGLALDEVLAAHPELRRIVAEAVERGDSALRRECAIERGGERRLLGLTVHALRRDDGGARGHLALFADLTEARREADATRLAESLAQLGELAAGVAHELRNGLATLRGYLTLIERRPEEGTVEDYLAEMRRECDHLHRVVQDFLAFARPGTARLAAVDLAQAARRAAADPALGGAAVVVAEEGGPAPAVQGDPLLVERALRNLLANAAAAQREAGVSEPVRVAVRGAPAALEVAVEDRGPGVPAEVRSRLFQPFASGRPGGVGLGLALAHRIVALHGGTLRLEDRPGGGTRAILSVPADRFVTRSDTLHASPAPGQGGKIGENDL